MEKKNRAFVCLMKITNTIAITAVFWIILHYFYLPALKDDFYQEMEPVIIFLFVLLYISLCRMYNGVHSGADEIGEIVYSQSLSIILTNVILFIVMWLLGKQCPALFTTFLSLGSQLMISIIWAVSMKRIYKRITIQKKTAVLYYEERDCEYLQQVDAAAKQFHVEKWIYVPGKAEEILLELKGMEVVFVRGLPSDERNTVLKFCMMNGIEIYMYPKLGDVMTGAAKQISMFHVPVMYLRGYTPSAAYVCLKRIADIILSLTGIIVLSPLLVGIAAAVKFCDGGTIFYRQERLTQNGNHFLIYKFRSMKMDSERDGIARLAADGDTRITSVGKILRRTHMDELPQLFNILKGDMSLVGPRPERPEIAAAYSDEMPEFALRLQVKAGLTGYAQVYGKYNSNPYDKLQMDLMYMAHLSLLSDLKILLATIKVLFTKENVGGKERKVMMENRLKNCEWENVRKEKSDIQQKIG